MRRGHAEKPAEPMGVPECRVAQGREVGAMRLGGYVMLLVAVQFFVLGEPSAPGVTAPAGFLFPAASAERFLPAEGLALSLPISSLVKTLAGFPECGFWARAFRAASPRESDWDRGALAEVTWVRPTDTLLKNRRAAPKKINVREVMAPTFQLSIEFGLAPFRSLAVRESTGRRVYCGRTQSLGGNVMPQKLGAGCRNSIPTSVEPLGFVSTDMTRHSCSSPLSACFRTSR
jgi:hypothetical protein